MILNRPFLLSESGDSCRGHGQAVVSHFIFSLARMQILGPLLVPEVLGLVQLRL